MAEERETRAQGHAEAWQETSGREDDYWFRFTVEAPRFMVMSREVGNHLRGAQREMLMAVRSLVDTAIERLDGDGRGRGRRTTRIQVE